MSTLKTTNLDSAAGINTITVNADIDASGKTVTASQFNIDTLPSDKTYTGNVTFSNINITGGKATGLTSVGVSTIYVGDGSGAQGKINYLVEDASLTGTVNSYSGIPSWAKRIDVWARNVVQTGGSADLYVTLGSTLDTEITTGYVSTSSIAGGGSDSSSTTSFVILAALTSTHHVHMQIMRIADDTWSSFHSTRRESTTAASQGGGVVSGFSGIVDQIYFGTNATSFSGNITITYE